jgi:group I intron endonuclease
MDTDKDKELIYGIIYAIYFPNDKLYIGQTIRTLYTRIQEHKLKSKNSTLLVHKAINKYGFENINYEVIDYAYSFEELNELEKYYISKFESFFETNKGYNMTLGGEGSNGYVYTTEDRLKMSEIQKEYRKNNPEEAQKQSERLIQYYKDNPDKAIQHGLKIKKLYSENPEIIDKISNSLKIYYTNNPEILKKMSDRERERYINNPELRTQKSVEKTNLYETNPQIKTTISNSLKDFHKNNENARYTLTTEKIKQKHRNSLINSAEKRANKKPFKVLDINNNYIGQWDYVPECARKLFPDNKKNNIYLCLSGKIKSTKGYKFEYL